MTLEQLRLFESLLIGGVTQLAQGAEILTRQLEVYNARGGNAAINALKTEHPNDVDEIERIQALLADAGPLVTAVNSGLMADGGDLRERLMRLRGDA